jgi:hypothetical protein
VPLSKADRILKTQTIPNHPKCNLPQKANFELNGMEIAEGYL